MAVFNTKSNSFIGIDEAGLGPIFGPLVIAGTVIEERHEKKLKNNGVKDSKLFERQINAREKRRSTWIKNKIYIKNSYYISISASEIDKNFENGITMYDLEIEGILKIINTLFDDSIKEIIIHQIGGLSKKSFLGQLEKNDDEISSVFPLIKYEKSADLKYIPVSMASIIAKSVRDEIVEKICYDIGFDYISGYPNQVTANFLINFYSLHGILPPEVRTTRNWDPLQKIIQDMKD